MAGFELDRASRVGAPSKDEMRDHVARVLESDPFARSPRMRRFLRFLCDEVLADRGGSLKEYKIALAVFDKSSDFDPGSSAVIRVEAGRLRRLLAQYETEFGQADVVRLSIPKGAYCPIFEYKRGHDAEDQTNEEPIPPGAAPALCASGERRWLTVVSCALGETAYSDVDDGYLRAYDEAYKVCISIANRYGGLVDAGAGSDRVMIYFGWPEALEDAAGRAMTCAFAIIDALDGAFEPHGGIRIGIATSLVAARQSAGASLLIGQAPALASKMLALASQGAILISENTRRLTDTAFEMISAGPAEGAHGEQNLIWRVLGPSPAKTRFDTRRSERGLVGRNEEVALLLGRWRLAVAGEGQVVVIEGEPGIGKSSVVEAALREIGSDGNQIRIQCSAHHSSIALYPCIALIRELVKAADGAVPSKERTRDLLDRLGLNDPTSSTLLSDLLSEPAIPEFTADLTARDRKELTFQLLLRLLFAQTERRSTVLFVEDIHWADPSTLELIDRVIAATSSRRLLVLMTARSDPSSKLPSRTSITFVRLSRLPSSACNEIIDRISGWAPLSKAARSEILERAEGIPLFLEELTKLLLTGDARAEIPDSLDNLLASQLGRLGYARSIAQIASVIGRDFSSALVKEVAGDDSSAVDTALDQLVAAGVVRRATADLDGSFSFRHALLREAAYASILPLDRREVHDHVAKAIAGGGLQSGEHPEIIAEHLNSAGRFDDAVTYWMGAGRRAARRYELAEAIADFRRALEALARSDVGKDRRARELELLLELGLTLRTANGYADPELRPLYERARALAHDLDRPDLVASAIYGLWTHAAGHGQWPVASLLADEFHRHIETISDDGQLQIEALRLRGASAAFSGQFGSARLHFERVIDLYDVARHGPRFGFDPGAASAAYLSWVLWHLGEVDRAQEYAERALSIADAKAHHATFAMVLAWLIFHAVCAEDFAAIARHNERLQALCIEGDCRYWQPFGAACAEWAAFCQDGEPRHLERLLRLTGEFREHYLDSCLLVLAADVCRKMGNAREGLDVISKAKPMINDHGERLWEAEYHRLTGELLLALPEAGERKASPHFRRALSVAMHQGAVSLKRRAVLSMDAACAPVGSVTQPETVRTRGVPG